MNPGVLTRQSGSARGLLIEGYEALRQHVLEREAHRGWGLSLFRNRGMAGWAEAWARCTPKPEKPAPHGVGLSAGPGARLPPRTEELVRVLSAMVWACQGEGAP